METIAFTVTGIEPLLQNNPQTVDPLNKYSKLRSEITSKRKKTDDDILELRRLDIESKTYYDDQIGVYIPATWVTAAIGGVSWSKAKIKKADIRSTVFTTESKIPLKFAGMDKVKKRVDIAGNPEFQQVMLLKQGQVKVAKNAPIFRDWSFSSEIEFDPNMINRKELQGLLSHAALYGGFGDFRPTYGRAQVAFE